VKKTAVVIIPTYNERENIGVTVERLLQVFETISTWKMEILVVDDTSPDKTYELVREMQKKSPELHLLLNKKKSGLGGAYLVGMAHAFGELKSDLVFEFDADLSHDPKKIPDFLEKIDAESDMVLGSRYIPGGGIPKDWGMHRKFLSIFGNLIIMTVLTRFSIRDWTTGFRAITKKVYEAVHPNLSSERFSGYTFQIGFLYTAVKMGFKVTEVPFVFADRTHGHSKLGPEYLKNTLLFIFKVRLQEIFASRIFKFAVVGATGAVIQLTSLTLYRLLVPEFSYYFLTSFFVATFASIETAIIANFFLSNKWTFADRQLEKGRKLIKFIQFNLTSAGSLLIQLLIAVLGETLIGLRPLFTIPFVGFVVESGLIFAVTGILVGMVWNFFAYTTFIWKKKK